MKTTDRILEAFSLIWTSNVWPHTPNEIVKILLYAHSKGWLYLVIKDDKLVGLTIAYSVENIEQIGKKLPLESKGRILFIPLTVSKDGFKRYCMRRFNAWIKDHKSEFDELVFEKNDILVRKPMEAKNGKEEQRSGVTESSDVLSESKC